MTRAGDPSILSALTRPRAVALVGASGSAHRVTARPVRFLRQHGFAGSILPVNPNRDEILGLPAFRSIGDLPDSVDHAYVLLDAEAAITAVEDCARAGIKVVSVLADGFAEAGAAGHERQRRLIAAARSAGIFLIGPNSMGVVDTRSSFVCTTNAAFAADTLPRGRFAVVSQSGSIIGTIVSRGAARGLGFSTFVSVGNEALVGVGEIGRVLLEDPECDGLLLFLETIRNPETVAAMARRAHALGKPIVAYAIGRSDEGQALSVSHTGAMTGGTRALDAFLRHHGIARVETFEALLEAPQALALAPRMRNRPKTVTVVSTTGGGGAMVVDQISARGITIAGCSPQSRAALEADKVPLGSGKLVDVTLAGARYEVMKAVISTLISDSATGLLVVAIGSSAQFNPELAVKPIIDARQEAGDTAAPVLAFPLPHAEASLGLFEAAGIPAFRTLESCAETVRFLIDGTAPEPQPEKSDTTDIRTILERVSGGGRVSAATLSEVDAARIFAAAGVHGPQQIVIGRNEPIPLDLPFPFPVVAKVIAANLPHKSEAGGVRIGIANRDDLIAEVGAIRQSVSQVAPGTRIDGFLVQEQRRGIGEAIIGLTRDPLVGPVVSVGVGGTATEIYGDVAVRPAPVTRAVAEAMLDEVKGFALLRGFRGRQNGDLAALADAVVAVSTLAQVAEIDEAEINPVIVGPAGEGVCAVDALVRLRDG